MTPQVSKLSSQHLLFQTWHYLKMPLFNYPALLRPLPQNRIILDLQNLLGIK